MRVNAQADAQTKFDEFYLKHGTRADELIVNSIQIRKTAHGWRVDQYRDDSLIFTATMPRKLDARIAVKTCKRYFDARNLQYTVEVATTNRKKNQ